MASAIDSSQGAVAVVTTGDTLPNAIRAPRVVTIRPQDLGLQVYHDPQDADEITLDVVAVHGIGVDPTNTWTHPKTNKNWLRDETMLPQELPSARIMAFAYNSVWYGDDAVKQSLESVANSLLRDLGDRREEFVVDQTSGTLNGHQSQQLSLDHFGMNKFEDAQDSHYRNVKREIVKIIKAHANSEGQEPMKSPLPSHHHDIPKLGAPIAIEANFAPRDSIIPKINGLFKKKQFVALYGSLGNGKTHIAVQFAHEYKRQNPGHGVYWIGASSTSELQSSYIRIAEQLHINQDSQKNKSLIELVFERLKREPSLIVFDGMDSESSLSSVDFTSAKPLADLVPTTTKVNVLITTRSKAVARHLVGNRDKYVVEVGPVSLEDASMILLGKVTRDPSRKKFVEHMSSILDGSAGALTLVYFYLKNAGKESNRKDYSERLSSKSAEKSAVLKAWQLLYELINQMHKDTVDTMLIMSCLNVQCIPSELFERKVVQNCMPVLEGFGFVEMSADRQLFAMTAIVREQAKEFLNHNIQQRQDIQDRAAQSIQDRFDAEASEALVPCALAVLGLQHVSPQRGQRSQTDLLFSIARYYNGRGNHQKALEYFQQCLKSREADINLPNRAMMIEMTRQAIIEVENVLNKPAGPTELDKGEPGASSAATRTQFAAPMLGSSGPTYEGDSVNYNDCIESVQRGLRQASKGNHRGAEKLYLYVIQELQAQMNSRKPDMELIRFHLKVLSCLAATYCAQGKFTEALNILKTVIPEQEAVIGKSNPETLLTRNDYALLLQDSDPDAADQELRMLHKDQIRLLGADSPDALSTESNLALNSSLRGNFKESESLYRDVLQRQKSKLGEKDHDVMATQKMLNELLEREESKL
ncbi:hypothetical protein ACHAQD_009247 [Fusarium lateritium]